MKHNLIDYLGNPAADMLKDSPFNQWPVKRSFGEDPEEPSFHYVFPQHGLELRCDDDDQINVIFLYSEKYNGFDDSLINWRFCWGRSEVRARLGVPSKSAERSSSVILGDSGPWDRFENVVYSLHFEYGINANHIDKITIMISAVVP